MLWLAGAVVAAAAIILIPNAQSIPRVGGAQELAARESLDGLPGIGGALQAVGAGKAKSSQEVHVAQSQEEPQDFQGLLERYFTELYSVLSDDAENFSSEGFASIDGYMVGKHLMERRYFGNAFYGGIDNVRLQKVKIQSMEESGDRI